MFINYSSPLCNDIADRVERSDSKVSRDASIDWIAGLLTLVVIIQHVDDLSNYALGWKEYQCGSFFYFYMAWFFFKSGIFNKTISLQHSYKKIWSHLIVPCLFFSVLSWVIWVPGYLLEHGGSWNWVLGATVIRFYSLGYIPDNGPLWFMVALIICRLMYPLAKKWLGNDFFVAGVAWLLAFIYYLVYHSFYHHQYIFIALPQGLMALSIYSLAICLRKWQYSPYVFIVGIAVYAVKIYLNLPVIDFSKAGLENQPIAWLFSLPLWLGGILMLNNFMYRMPKWFFKIFNLGYIGHNSMTYYCGHFIILTTLVFLYHHLGICLFGLPLVWAMVVSCTVILPVADVLLRRYLPWAVGLKLRRHGDKGSSIASDPLP